MNKNKDKESVDSFIDKDGRVWVRNKFPNKPWTVYVDEIAADLQLDDAKSRSFHTETEAKTARELAGSSELIESIRRHISTKQGCIGAASATMAIAVCQGLSLYVYTHADQTIADTVPTWQQAGGYVHHALTLGGFIKWLESLPFTTKPN